MLNVVVALCYVTFSGSRSTDRDGYREVPEKVFQVLLSRLGLFYDAGHFTGFPTYPLSALRLVHGTKKQCRLVEEGCLLLGVGGQKFNAFRWIQSYGWRWWLSGWRRGLRRFSKVQTMYSLGLASRHAFCRSSGCFQILDGSTWRRTLVCWEPNDFQRRKPSQHLDD